MVKVLMKMGVGQAQSLGCFLGSHTNHKLLLKDDKDHDNNYHVLQKNDHEGVTQPDGQRVEDYTDMVVVWGHHGYTDGSQCHCGLVSKLYTPPPFLVDSWSIPSIPVHSQESLGGPGSFPPHSQFIPGPFTEQGGVGMGGEKKGGGERVYEAEERRRRRDGV
jgi:hypothetical protein